VRNAENRANSGAKSFVGVSGSKFGQKMKMPTTKLLPIFNLLAFSHGLQEI
jgi:hypothetical protein